MASAVIRRVEAEALELETREKLHLLCLAETRHDAKWACLVLKGWTKDKLVGFIPCLAVKSRRMEEFVASQRRPGGGRQKTAEEEEEEVSARLTHRVASALDKFVRCDRRRLESLLLKAQCAALGYKFAGDARLRTKLLRCGCNSERENLLISFLHDPVCNLKRFWRNL